MLIRKVADVYPVAEQRSLRLHGHEVTYRTAGTTGPVVLLVHGIAGNSANWDGIIGRLAARGMQAVAPDLLGHGASAKPRGDYSLGAYAAGLRDLLLALGHQRATVVGHSLGGGVAMQYAYQFPQHCERLVLVDSGGLGHEVSIILRLATLPGAEYVLPALATVQLRAAGRWVAARCRDLPVTLRPGVTELLRGFGSLADAQARQVFVHTVRSVIDIHGQRVSAHDRLYLAADMPTLIMWGQRDAIIPVEHAHAAAATIPHSQLVIFERSGHFPHLDEPERFAHHVADFITDTPAADPDPGVLQARLQRGKPAAQTPEPVSLVDASSPRPPSAAQSK
ncbi:MAG TPA: alpha/beta hydrolase [Jatrophihabitans sp.]|nr:alpha/beta hydrolase [Jatrophihabitans sp.]